MADRRQHVLQLAVLGQRVVDVVRDDDRQAQLVGQARVSATSQSSSGSRWCWSSRTKPASAMRMARRTGPAARTAPAYRSATARAPSRSPDPQPPRELAVAAARQRDQALRVLREQRVGEPRHPLGAGQVRPADQPAQAPIARRVAREQHEVRPALRLADPAQVLLHERRDGRAAGPARAAAGAAGPPAAATRATACRRRRAPMPAAGWAARRRGARAPSTERPAAGRRQPRAGTTIPPGSGDERVEQLHLEPDDGGARLPRRGREPDRAVEALVVGDGERRSGPARRPARRGRRAPRPVEEREVAVAVELGVGPWTSTAPGALGSRVGAAQYRTSVRWSWRNARWSLAAGSGRVRCGRCTAARAVARRSVALLRRCVVGLGACRSRASCPTRSRRTPASSRPEFGPARRRMPASAGRSTATCPGGSSDPAPRQRLRYDLLTTIAFFGIGIERDGDLDTRVARLPGATSAATRSPSSTPPTHHGVRVVPDVPAVRLRAAARHAARSWRDTAAQQRFIAPGDRAHEAAARPTARTSTSSPCPTALGRAFAAFVARFRTALLKRRCRDATLVVALDAGASRDDVIETLAPLVDQLFIMAYDYRTTRSASAGRWRRSMARWLQRPRRPRALPPLRRRRASCILGHARVRLRLAGR